MKLLSPDADLANADWPKRTRDYWDGIATDFDPNEKRDDDGKWTTGGGSTSSTAPASAPADEPDEDTKEQRSRLRDFEIKHYKSPIEHAQAVLPQGESLMTAPDGLLLGKDGVWGSANHIPFTTREIEKMSNRDVVFTHNHPKGWSLSKADIRLAIHCNMKEMRAFGNGKVFSMRRGPNGWPTEEEFGNECDDIDKTLTAEYPTAESWGAVDNDTASGMWCSAVMRSLANAFPGKMVYAESET